MKIPEYPGVNLTIYIFYLAQLTVVGNDYTGPALFVDDLLTGDAPGQFLRRSGRRRAAKHQESERQDHSIHDFAPRRAWRRARLEHTTRRGNAMVMMVYGPLVIHQKCRRSS